MLTWKGGSLHAPGAPLGTAMSPTEAEDTALNTVVSGSYSLFPAPCRFCQASGRLGWRGVLEPTDQRAFP